VTCACSAVFVVKPRKPQAVHLIYNKRIAMADDSITISPGPQFRTAMLVAIAADALQIVIFPAFAPGAFSPVDDLLDIGVAALMVQLLGWHWEFLPSFFAKLVPGVDLVPFWSLAVASVWRKAKRMAESATKEQLHQLPPPRPTKS